MAESTIGARTRQDQRTGRRVEQAETRRSPAAEPHFPEAAIAASGLAPDALARALANSGASTRADVVGRLQQSAGNASIQRMVAGSGGPAPAAAVQRQTDIDWAQMMAVDSGAGASPEMIGYAVPEALYADQSSSGHSAPDSGAGSLLDIVMGGFRGAKSEWGAGMRSARREAMRGLSGAGSSFFGGINSAVGQLGSGFGEAGSALWNGVPGEGGGFLEDMFGRLGAAGSAVGSGVGSAASTFVEGVGDAGSSLWGGLTGAASSAWGGATDAAGEIGSAASDVWDYLTG